MPRSPARIERVGALTPRDRMWAAIRALSRYRGRRDSPVTPAEVIFLTGIHRDTVCTYFRGLQKAQPPYLRLVDGHRPFGNPHRACARYELVRDVGIEAPCVSAEGRETQPAQANHQM